VVDDHADPDLIPRGVQPAGTILPVVDLAQARHGRRADPATVVIGSLAEVTGLIVVRSRRVGHPADIQVSPDLGPQAP
jgi:hypothetical protein